MAMKNLALAVAMGVSGVLAGCSSPAVVTHTDGSQVTTRDTPEYDEESGFYTYDRNGAQVRVNKDRVERIEDVK